MIPEPKERIEALICYLYSTTDAKKSKTVRRAFIPGAVQAAFGGKLLTDPQVKWAIRRRCPD